MSLSLIFVTQRHCLHLLIGIFIVTTSFIGYEKEPSRRQTGLLTGICVGQVVRLALFSWYLPLHALL